MQREQVCNKEKLDSIALEHGNRQHIPLTPETNASFLSSFLSSFCRHFKVHFAPHFLNPHLVYTRIF